MASRFQGRYEERQVLGVGFSLESCDISWAGIVHRVLAGAGVRLELEEGMSAASPGRFEPLKGSRSGIKL
ncbi:MAG: hypothetical protein LC723_04505 [Actinobacteria bacterium]|nr:hypothetical protein [Actinomycetota bacterium]